MFLDHDQERHTFDIEPPSVFSPLEPDRQKTESDLLRNNHERTVAVQIRHGIAIGRLFRVVSKSVGDPAEEARRAKKSPHAISASLSCCQLTTLTKMCCEDSHRSCKCHGGTYLQRQTW